MNPYLRTFNSNPELWLDGASFMCKVAYKPGGGQGVIASGWHLRQITFENSGVRFEVLDNSIGYHFINTATRPTGHFWDDVENFEFEASLDDPNHLDSIKSALQQLTGGNTAESLVDSMHQMVQRASANRADNAVISSDETGTVDYVDLLCQNLPSRSGDMSQPIQTLYRWCRVFSLPHGTITLYQALDGQQLPNLRWPHPEPGFVDVTHSDFKFFPKVFRQRGHVSLQSD